MAVSRYLFCTEDLSARLENARRKIADTIAQEKDEYITSVNEAAYVASVESQFLVDELQFFPERAHIAWEGDRAVSFDSRFGGKATRNVHHVTFAVPWSGPEWLLHCQPNQFSTCQPGPEVTRTELRWTFSTENRTPEEIKRQFDSEVNLVGRYVGWVNEMVKHWNEHLRQVVEPSILQRKERLQKGAALAASFGLPVRSRSPAQQPLPVPVTRKRIVMVKPHAAVTPAERARILDEAVYEEILANLRNMNLVIERNPSAFAGMDEETLRWHFLVQLNNNFEIGATGETFSKKGKTDIYLPADGRAAFIAECKFWTGPSSFSPIIDQLLGYLTWRDTKTSILLFVRNKDFSSVVGQIVSLTQNHPNHVRFLGEKHPAEFRFLFRSRDASNEFLTVAIMCFHLPSE